MCAGDAALRRQVEALLRVHDEPDSLLDSPRIDLGLRDDPGASPNPTLDQPITGRPGTVIGPHKLLQQIGEGGMGAVYMAEQTEPVERQVALKIIKPGMDTRQVVARFEAERHALAMMDHPNIARVLDAGTTDSGRPYFVMELVKGVPITQYCDEHHLTPRQRLELFVPVCHAVQHAHQKGIIHRDIKPTNVLVAEYDDRPVPKIIDFGVAKAIQQRLSERTMFTDLGQVVGTIDYMSPEQAKLNQLDIDTRSDIYSLGVLLYELLTGETPLDRQRLRSAAFDEMLRIIREEEPPKPSLRLSSSDSLPSIAANRQIEPKRLSTLVRGELDWIVMKALEKDRSRRYETANGLARDIENHLDDEPVLACPPSAGYRLRKFARRNKRPMWAVGLVLLALVAGIVGTTLGLLQARTAAEAEREARAAETTHRLRAEDAAEAERNARAAETAHRLRAENAADAERKAREAETTERVRAQDNAKLAIEVLDETFLKEARLRVTFYTRNAAERPPKSPEREKREREFLEKGLRFYEKLAQANATDWTARRERAKAYAKVALLRLDLRDFVESEKAYGQAVRLMEELAEERPQDFENRFDLANTYHWFCAPYRETGRFQPAADVTRHALALFEKLAVDFPDRRSQARLDAAQCQRKLGDVLQRAGKLQEAEKVLQQSLALWSELAAVNPAAPELRDAVARAHFDLADFFFRIARRMSEAEKAYRQAITIWESLGTDQPNRREYRQHAAFARGTLAEVLSAANRKKEAEETCRQTLAAFEKLLADFPGERAYRGGIARHERHLGHLFKDTGRPREAEESYRRSIGLWEKLAADYPAEPFYRWDQAFTSCKLAALLADTGRAQEAEKLYRQAVAINEKLVRDFPDNTEYRWRLSWNLGDLAENLLQQGNHAEAAKVAEKIDGPAAQNLWAWHMATHADPQLRDPALAVALATKAVQREPTQGMYWNTLGAAQYRAGDWKAAIQSLRKASQLYQGRLFSHVAFFLAMAHWQLGEKDHARKWYTPAVLWMDKRDPKNEELRRFRAEAAALLGLPEQPPPAKRQGQAGDLEIANLMVEADPSAAWAYQHRGNAYAALRQWDKAAADYAKSIELQPRGPAPWSSRAGLHAEQAKWDSAIADLSKAIQLDPNDPNLRYLRAMVCLSAGRADEYRKHCAEMLQRFGQADKPGEARWVAWTCAVRSDAVADWTTVVALGEKAAKSHPRCLSCMSTSGAALYRAGRFEEALARLKEAERLVTDPSQNLQWSPAYTWLFLAMAHHRLGHAEESRQWLDKGVTWTDKALREHEQGVKPLPWNRRLTLKLLRQEAETLLPNSEKPPATKEKPK